MPDYRRVWCADGTYFFTVNLLQRKNNPLFTTHIQLLRDAVRVVRAKNNYTQNDFKNTLSIGSRFVGGIM